MNEPKRESAPADDGRLETPVRPCAWAHRYSPRGLLHTLRDNQQDAEDDAAIVGGSAHAVALYDERALDEAVAAERERCAVVAWMHYMDTCQKHGRAPSMWHEWCASGVIRGA